MTTFIGAGAVDLGKNPVVPVPAGVAAGDTLLIVATSASGFILPAGWDVEANKLGKNCITVLTKIADGTETEVLLKNGSTHSAAVMLAYSGDAGTDGSSFNDPAGESLTSISTNSINTTQDGDTIVSVFATDTNCRSVGTPGSTTLRAISLPLAGGSTANGLLICDEVQTTQGSTSVRTASLSPSCDAQSFALALKG